MVCMKQCLRAAISANMALLTALAVLSIDRAQCGGQQSTKGEFAINLQLLFAHK